MNFRCLSEADQRIGCGQGPLYAQIGHTNGGNKA
jgi:hypothetical protein